MFMIDPAGVICSWNAQFAAPRATRREWGSDSTVDLYAGRTGGGDAAESEMRKRRRLERN